MRFFTTFGLLAAAFASNASDPTDKLFAAMRGPTWEKRVEASLDLARLGREAVSPLVRELRDPKSQKVEGYSDLLAAAALRIVLANPRETMRITTELGWNHPTLGSSAILAFALAPDDALALCEGIGGYPQDTQEALLEGLALHRNGARSLAGPVAALLADSGRGDGVRARATQALAMLGPLDEPAIETLQRALSDPSPNVSLRALWALSRQPGPVEERLMPALGNLKLSSPTIALLASRPDLNVETLQHALETSSDALTVCGALIVLGLREPRTPELQDVLVGHCTHEVPSIRSAALAGAASMLAERSVALELIEAALADPDASVRQEAAMRAIDWGEAACRELAPALFAALSAPSTRDPDALLQALGEADQWPAEVIEPFLELALAPDNARASGFMTVLRRGGETARLSLLARYRSASSREERGKILVMLAQFSAAALPDLLALADAAEPDLHGDAVVAMGLVGVDSPEVLAHVRRSFESPDERFDALLALEWLGAGGDEMRIAACKSIAKEPSSLHRQILAAARRQSIDRLETANAAVWALEQSASFDTTMVAIVTLGASKGAPKKQSSALLGALRNASKNRAPATRGAESAQDWTVQRRHELVATLLDSAERIEDCHKQLLGVAEELLADPDGRIAARAAKTFEVLGSKAGRYSPSIAAQLGRDDPAVVTAALNALRGIGADADEVALRLGTVGPQLLAGDAYLAASALERIGPQARIALPHLLCMALSDGFLPGKLERTPREGKLVPGALRIRPRDHGDCAASLSALNAIESILDAFPQDRPLALPMLERLARVPIREPSEAALRLIGRFK